MSDAPKATTASVIATAIGMPVIFFVGWFLCQWVWWILGDVFDALSPLIGPRGYDPKEIGFLQQLFRDLVPTGASMIGTVWVHSKFFGSGRKGYRIGASIIVFALTAAALYSTWAFVEENPFMDWRAVILQWATVAVVILIARWAEKDSLT